MRPHHSRGAQTNRPYGIQGQYQRARILANASASANLCCESRSRRPCKSWMKLVTIQDASMLCSAWRPSRVGAGSPTLCEALQPRRSKTGLWRYHRGVRCGQRGRKTPHLLGIPPKVVGRFSELCSTRLVRQPCQTLLPGPPEATEPSDSGSRRAVWPRRREELLAGYVPSWLE